MMRRAAIFGSGFGLYGYMPALINNGVKEILLPQRYREKFSMRPELQIFTGNISWVADENEALARADGLVTALRPDMQAGYITACLKLPGIQHLLLEKPLAPSPEISCMLLDMLVASGRQFRIGYIFGFLPWEKNFSRFLQNDVEGRGEITIRWQFMAHHFKHDLSTWKRDHAAGGGALRFYGIHVLAMLAGLGYNEVDHAMLYPDEGDRAVRWVASFSGKDLPRCVVDIDTHAQLSQFGIDHVLNGCVTTLVDLTDPFAELCVSEDGTDRRGVVLAALYRSLQQNSPHAYRWYRATLDLWSAAEQAVAPV